MRAQKQSVIYLVRHGHSQANLKGVLAGRDDSVRLSPRGKVEADFLALALKELNFDTIFSSPINRCLETLAPVLATRTNQKIEILDEFTEMDYGDWTGKKLSSLSRKKDWSSVQNSPSLFRFPNGESFSEMLSRVNEGLLEVSRPGKIVLVCTHSDIIKAIVNDCAGSHLDNFQRIIIDPASISIVARNPERIIFRSNSTAHLKASK